MHAWLDRIVWLLKHFFVRAAPNETYAVIAIAVLLGALALSRVGTGLGAIGSFFGRGLVLVAGGLVLLIAGMAFPPAFGLNCTWMPVAASGLVLLCVVLPITMFSQKGSYVTALISWTVALLVVGAFLTLEPTIMRFTEKAVSRGYQLQNFKTTDWGKK